MSHPTSLPTELLTEIFRHDQLSKSDLANCCLLARRYLPLTLEFLYNSVTLDIYRVGSFNEPEDIKWVYTSSCDQFLVTLEDRLKLGRLVKKITIEVHEKRKEELSPSVDLMRPDRSLQTILNLVPNVNSLRLPEDWQDHPRIKRVVSRTGSRWTELDVDGDIDLSRVGGWKIFPNLKKLRCWSYGYRERLLHSAPIPDTLDTLDCWGPRPLGSELPPPPTDSNLRVFRTQISHDALWFITQLTKLEHLVLIESPLPLSPSPDPSVLSQFSHLPSLKSLTYKSSHRTPYFHPTLALLLSHLPPSVERLDFPHVVPFDQLETFFASPVSSSIRTLGLSRKVVNSGVFSGQVDTLRKVCQAKGIEIDLIDEAKGVFRESLDCSHSRPTPRLLISSRFQICDHHPPLFARNSRTFRVSRIDSSLFSTRQLALLDCHLPCSPSQPFVVNLATVYSL